MHTEIAPDVVATSWAFEEEQEIVPGRWAVMLLGGGERCEAWLAWDERLHTLVVAKLLRPHLLGTSRAIDALVREAEALQRLSHPSIVRCFEAHVGGWRPHLVLESLDGPRLSTLLRRFGPFAQEQLVALALEIGSALMFMHDSDYLHLDVKPRNIIMSATPKLIDLGVARRFDEIRRLTSPIGTDAYMAPEQTSTQTIASVGPPADAWGLAITLYEAVEGQLPFPSAAEFNESYPQRVMAPRPVRRDVHPAIKTMIDAGLASDPHARPTVEEMVETMQVLLPAARYEAHRRLRRRFR